MRNFKANLIYSNKWVENINYKDEKIEEIIIQINEKEDQIKATSFQRGNVIYKELYDLYQKYNKKIKNILDYDIEKKNYYERFRIQESLKKALTNYYEYLFKTDELKADPILDDYNEYIKFSNEWECLYEDDNSDFIKNYHLSIIDLIIDDIPPKYMPIIKGILCSFVLIKNSKFENEYEYYLILGDLNFELYLVYKHLETRESYTEDAIKYLRRSIEFYDKIFFHNFTKISNLIPYLSIFKEFFENQGIKNLYLIKDRLEIIRKEFKNVID